MVGRVGSFVSRFDVGGIDGEVEREVEVDVLPLVFLLAPVVVVVVVVVGAVVVVVLIEDEEKSGARRWIGWSVILSVLKLRSTVYSDLVHDGMSW